jgi:hypothetical protein
MSRPASDATESAGIVHDHCRTGRCLAPGSGGKGATVELLLLVLLIVLIVAAVGGGVGYRGGVYRTPGLGLAGVLLVILLILLLLGYL